MKKILKNRIFIFFMGMIIAGSITAYATSQIMSSQVTYNNTTVDLVLDDLYTKANRELTFGTKLNAYNIGDRTVERSKTLQLNKGKYIVYLVNADTYTEGSKGNSIYGSSSSTNLQCNSC